MSLRVMRQLPSLNTNTIWDSWLKKCALHSKTWPDNAHIIIDQMGEVGLQVTMVHVMTDPYLLVQAPAE